MAAKLVALAESCTVNSTAYAVSDDIWTRVLGSDSFVHVVFSNPRRVQLKSSDNQKREERMVREVLLPLPVGSDPPHVYVKTGGETVSVTKYDPFALRELVLEEELRLRTVPPYDFLLNLPSTR